MCVSLVCSATNAPVRRFLDVAAPSTKSFIRVDLPPSSIDGAAPPRPCVFTSIGVLRSSLFSGSQSIDSRAPGLLPHLYASSVAYTGVRAACIVAPTGAPCPGFTGGPDSLPCDSGPCYDTPTFFVVTNGSVFTGGTASAYPDWPSATLLQRASSIDQALATGSGLALLSSTAMPTSPIPSGSVVAALNDPENPTEYPYLQSLTTGARACLTSDNSTTLMSLQVFGPRPEDFGIVLNVTIPACPLPLEAAGGAGAIACFSLAVAHVSPFTGTGSVS